MEPPSLSTELRKLLLWLTLACFSRKFVQKRIDWTSRLIVSLSKTIEMGVVLPQSGRGFTIFARNCTIGTLLQEILDPPLISDYISAIEAPVSMCVRTILTTFYHMNHYAAIGHVVNFFYLRYHLIAWA